VSELTVGKETKWSNNWRALNISVMAAIGPAFLHRSRGF
jgi:hypothetical protein